jgi:hypothetical protein
MSSAHDGKLVKPLSAPVRVARRPRKKKSRSNGKTVGMLVVALVVVLAVAAAWVAYGGGSAPAPTSTTGTSATTRVNTVVTAKFEPISALPLDPTCTGLNASQTADNTRVAASGLKYAYYDTQYWYYFNNNQQSVSYNVIAQPRTDTYGYGPALFVNGLTDKGYWYQAGLTYNWWRFAGKGYTKGFQMFYQVYNSHTAQPVYPYANGSTSPLNFTTLHEGDTVTLSLSIQGGVVIMKATDVQSGETLVKNYTSFGASYFAAADPKGNYPTSLMTEWPHVLPFLCMTTSTQFTSTAGQSFAGGWVETNVWNFTGYAINEWWESWQPGQFRMHTAVIPFIFSSTDEAYYLNYMGLGSYVESDGFYTM